MRKKLFTFLLAIVASVGSIFAASGTCGENLTWDLTDGVLTISGTGAMTDYSDSYSVPWYYYYSSSINSVLINDGVTSIGGYAFYYCNNLTSVTIPNSVTSIGTYAFYYCRKLESIAIPNSVTSIGEWAFYGCESLTSVTIPNSVTNIGNSAFSGCSSLTSIEIPNSVTNIGNSAFSGCSSLTSVTIGNSVTSIGSEAFSGCSNLTSIVIPNSVTNIGNSAFSGCSSLTSVTIGNSVTSIGKRVFYECKSLTSVTIPNSVTSIGDEAFYGCSSLPEVDFLLYADSYLVGTIEKNLPSYTIKEGTKWIGNRAFEDCSNMTSVIIPNSVTYIGGNAFEDCTSLTSIEIPNSVTRIGDYAFYGCTSLPVENNLRYADTYLVEAVDESLSTYTIKEGTKWIGSSAFSYCRSLTSIEIPNSVTSIGETAFRGCSGLTSIEIPNSVTSIGNDAFYYCYGLTSVTIPNSATNIGGSAFYGCSGLTSIEIPNSVTSIGGSAFYNVPNIVYSGSATGSPWGARSVNGYVEGWLVYEDASKTSLLACSTAAQGEIVMPNSVTSIENSAFKGCSKLISVTIPKSVISIGNDAFSGCIGLPVENNLRYADTYLVEAVDKSLSSYTIKEGTRWIGNGALKNCSKLTSVNIPSSVQFIEDEAFQDCGLLDSVVIPDNVISIGKQAFYRCGWRCDNVMFVSIGNSVTSIGERAFEGFKMTSLTIPNSVTSIGNSAFASCSSLNKIYSVSQNPPSISSNTFRNIPATSSVYVPRIARPTYKSDQYWTKLNIVGIGGETETSVLATSVIINASNELWEVVSDYIVSIGIEGGEQQAGNVLEYIGLDPNSEYKDVPVVLTSTEGLTETVNVSFTTTALELTTKPSQPVSNSVAILLAETNMSDAETSCGFEYKRNDAPDDMAGTKVFCPVASGTMAGRLKNLKDDVYYKYRAFYQSAAGKMYYGDWQYIFTGDVAVEFDPVLYTYTATAVTETTASISGYALAGSEDFTEQGFEYWAESRATEPATMSLRKMKNALGEHIFVPASGISMRVTLTDLDAGTIYKYRAYGKVGDQVYYGAEQTFTTRGKYVVPSYLITFVNWDGTELQKSQVATGTIPEYTGETPVRPGDDQYTYTFKGWTPELAEVTEDAVYTAEFTAEEATAILHIESDQVQCTKILRDGQILILRGDRIYTLTGQITQ